MTDTIPAPTPAQLAELHDHDNAMLEALVAFASAYRARQAAARRFGTFAGQLRLDTWTDSAILDKLGASVAALPSGENLDAAIGRAVLNRREETRSLQRCEEEKKAAAERVRRDSARLLESMNRRFREVDEGRAEALAVLDEGIGR